MKTNYRYFIPIAALAVVGSGIYGVQKVSAATATPGQQTLVDRLVSTFGLDKKKVQAVVDADRTAHRADREADYQTRLTKAVTDGKITEAQKALILTEHSKLEAERQTYKTDSLIETRAQRQAKMTAIKAEIDAWTKVNGIDAKWLGGHGSGHGPRMADRGSAPDIQ